jgi:hypothetical protein
MTTQLNKNILLTIFISIALPLNAFACKCDDGTVSENVKYSDVIFSGQVISKILTRNYDSLGVKITGDTSQMHSNKYEYPTVVVKIKVDTMYKGQLVSDTITILTPPNGAACGYYFQVGQKYIVYATILDKLPLAYKRKRRTFDNKTFWTHQCTRTQIWDSLEENDIINETK